MDLDKTCAELGIPGPPWYAGSHAGSGAGHRREAVILSCRANRNESFERSCP